MHPEDTIRAAVNVVVEAALRVLQADPHYWSDRPCETCRTITSLTGHKFGCYEYQRTKVKPSPALPREEKVMICPICKTNKYYCGYGVAIGSGWCCAAPGIGRDFGEELADLVKSAEDKPKPKAPALPEKP